MKNKIMIIALLSSIFGTLISAMDQEPLVVLELEPIGGEDDESYVSIVHSAPISRPLQAHELLAIFDMPESVKYLVMRGIRYQESIIENGIQRKKIIFKNYWINNKLSILADNDLANYQSYHDYMAQFMRKEQ